jgi:flagellar biogenesis protein FliO
LNTLLISRIFLIFIFIITIIILPQPLHCQEKTDAAGDSITGNSAEDGGTTFDLTEKTSDQKKGQAQAGNFVPIWDFIRMLIVLGCVVLVIYFFFFFLKKGLKKKMPANDLVKVISQVSLQGNESLFLIQTGLHYFLVGSGGSSPSLIAEITDKETIDTIRLKASSESTEPVKQNFSDILTKLFNPGKKRDDLTVNPFSFMKKQQERLNKLK